MLESLRRGAKSWAAKLLILLLIASFAVWGISDVFSFRQDSAVATVGDEIVTAADYSRALQTRRNLLSQRAGRAVSYADIRAAGEDRAILRQLMRERAFAAELDRLGLLTPDAAVAEAIRGVQAFQVGGAFSPVAYEQGIARQGFSPADFEDRTRVVLGRSLLLGSAAGPEIPTPGLAGRIAAFQGERRGIATLVIPLSEAPDPGTPGESALRETYEADPAAYTEPERRSGLYLEVSVPALAAAAEPSAAALRAYYDENAEALGQRATRVIDQLPLGSADGEAIAERLRSGALSFEAAARELGETPADLDLGEVSPGDLPGAVDEAVFAATEPGIVGPVAAPTGPVLIRVREVTLGGVPAFEDAEADIVQRLSARIALDRAAELANEIDDLRAAGRSLPEIAEETGLTLGRFEGLARDGGLPDGTRAQGLLATDVARTEIFEALDFEERDILETEDGGFFVVMVERIEARHLEPFEEVRERVAEDWAEAARRAALLEEAEEIAARLAGPETLAQTAAERGLPVTEHQPFPRVSAPRDIPALLIAELFAREAGEGAAAALEADGAGVMVGEVTEIAPLDPDQLSAISDRLEQALAAQVSADVQELFSRAIEASYPVEIEQDAVEAVFDQLGAARLGG